MAIAAPSATREVERAREALRVAAALRDARAGSIVVPCAKCGETVGHYRPGVVTTPSEKRPEVICKCTRSGCRGLTVVALDEVVI
jgi:hypothetical protein